jgi:hypothetical protein
VKKKADWTPTLLPTLPNVVSFSVLHGPLPPLAPLAPSPLPPLPPLPLSSLTSPSSPELTLTRQFPLIRATARCIREDAS